MVVFLHDALGSIQQWKDFPEKLCTQLQLKGLVIEREGHGESSPLCEERKKNYLEQEAATLALVLDQLEICQPILVGFSDGATIALLYATQFRISGGIAIAPHTFIEPKTIRGIKLALLGEKSILAKLQKYHPADVQIIWKSWWQTWLSDDFRRWNIGTGLSKILDPFLLIQSQDDPYSTLAQIEVIERRVNSQVVKLIVDGKAHATHLYSLRECVHTIKEFVSELKMPNHPPD